MIGHYMDWHINQQLAFIDSIKEVEIEKLIWTHSPDNPTSMKFTQNFNEINRNIATVVSDVLLRMHTENATDKDFTKKWLQNILNIIAKYEEKEVKMIDEDFSILPLGNPN
jgi:hypothetical protein